MTANRRQFEVVMFNCGHVATYSTSPPKMNETVVCGHCGYTVRVIQTGLPQWTASCITCAHSSVHGLHGRLSAEIAAAKHRRRKGCSQHSVNVVDPDGKITRTYQPIKTEPLFDVTDT